MCMTCSAFVCDSVRLYVAVGLIRVSQSGLAVLSVTVGQAESVRFGPHAHPRLTRISELHVRMLQLAKLLSRSSHGV